MKKLNFIFIALLFSTSAHSKSGSEIRGWSYGQGHAIKNSVVLQQAELAGNNISSFFTNAGIFNEDFRVTNHPGFEWPRGSGHYGCFCAGFTIATKINSVLQEASCFYNSEYVPGYINNSSGAPLAVTTNNFKVYKVSSEDSVGNNADYAMWYKMVPFGAPYIDINNNGIYDDGIDKPGVKNASSTVFVCLTDGFPESHTYTTGFGGGTLPVYSEIHFTAWTYDFGGMEDVQFLKWEVINKNIFSWDSTYMGIVTDPDLGYDIDDYIGCDTLLNLGYCYNGDNDDSGNSYSYGANPPAFGIDYIKGPVNRNVNLPVQLNLNAFCNFKNYGVACEIQPNHDVVGAYNYIKGRKIDGTQWVNPLNMQVTKFCYPGDPETNSGWTEFRGSVQNCNGSLTGTVLPVNYVSDKKMLLTTGSDNFKMQPNDTQNIVAAQMMARGTNNLNSVTKLKQLSVSVQNFFDNSLGVTNITSNIPSSFILYQNYPNPFNPTTNIKFDMVKSGFVTLKIYDASGKEVTVLINNEVVPMGTNEVSFDAKSVASGIYFYTLTTGTFTDTKKMVLVK